MQEVTENTWKLRLPNEWEPVRWWSDLLTWRCQVHNSTINMFKQVEVSHGMSNWMSKALAPASIAEILGPFAL